MFLKRELRPPPPDARAEERNVQPLRRELVLLLPSQLLFVLLLPGAEGPQALIKDSAPRSHASFAKPHLCNTLLTDMLHIKGALAVMSFGSITFAIAVFFCINAYVTAELCEQSHGPFVTYDALSACDGAFYALWTAVFRFWFRLCAVNTFTLFASWDAMEAAYLLGAYVSGASSLFPANWVLALGCGIALTSGLGQFMGVSRSNHVR